MSETLLKKMAKEKGIRYELAPLLHVLNQLDNPHKKIAPVIHVAGTNGKGSTVSLIAHSLNKAGQKVGTFTSPHLKSYQERISINFSPIPSDRFKQLFEQISTVGANLTEFERLTVMAFLYFSEQPLDFIILETGLGGRLDATNVVSPILTVITKIGLDHMSILGKNIVSIASEKAGIIKTGIPLITISTQPNEALDVFRNKTKDLKAPLTIVPPSKLDLRPLYQKENVALATEALSFLNHPFHLPPRFLNPMITPEDSFPSGRFTILTMGPQTIVIDGAHNGNAMSSLVESYKHQFPDVKPAILLGVLQTKSIVELLAPLKGFCSKLYYCPFSSDAFSSISEYTDIPTTIYPPHLLPQLPNDPWLIVTGSFHFVGKIL